MDNKFLNKLSTLLLNVSILTFIIAFNFADNPPGGWYQQFLPNLNGRTISDILFTDSLNGYSTGYSKFDPNYILKTTNGGDNWIITDSLVSWLTQIQFLNQNTGYVCGARLYKTTNAGLDWTDVNLPSGAISMNVLNEDSIWITDDNGLTGGIFLTTNEGSSWTNKFYQFGNNPEKIYFYDKDLGFATNGNLLRTSNGGLNWNVISGAGDFLDIYFIDSLVGWIANNDILKKSMDGGLSWVDQNFPPKGPNILLSRMYQLSVINLDTIWGVGGAYIYPNFSIRGMIYKTTNGGITWGFQIPDTTIRIGQYFLINFNTSKYGWSYKKTSAGVHTITGGNDTTFYVGVTQTSSEIPSSFVLKQNYPNPFNPTTTINYSLKVSSHVKLRIFNSIGEEVQSLVSQRQNAGEYEIEFDGSGLNSGVYFYKLEVSDNKSNSVFSETKKMLLVK